MTFSERYGYTPAKAAIQIEEIDTELRNSLWNYLSISVWSSWENYAEAQRASRWYNPNVAHFRSVVWIGFFKRPIDSAPWEWGSILEEVRGWYFKAPWYAVYDFIEFLLLNVTKSSANANQAARALNTVLERERAGYRVADWKFVRITDQNELQAIEQAATVTGPFDAASKHLAQSLSLLSDRRAPDYRNSIKESISAVEAATNILLARKGTLGDALKELQRKEIGLHKALVDGFIKIYGYTSDADGIRHALLEESNLSFDDAKFMLVACSAFVNYLQSFYIRAQQ